MQPASKLPGPPRGMMGERSSKRCQLRPSRLWTSWAAIGPSQGAWSISAPDSDITAGACKPLLPSAATEAGIPDSPRASLITSKYRQKSEKLIAVHKARHAVELGALAGVLTPRVIQLVGDQARVVGWPTS